MTIEELELEPATPSPRGAVEVPAVISSPEIVNHVKSRFSLLHPEAQSAISHALGQVVGGGISAGTSPDPTTNTGAVQGPLVPNSPLTQPGDPGYVAPPKISAPSSVAPTGSSPVSSPGASVTEMPLPSARMTSGRVAALESPRMSNPGVGSVSPEPRVQSPAVQELNRLQTTGTGTNKIKNPALKTAAVIGDVLGSGLFGRFTQNIPGFTAHHEKLLDNQSDIVHQEDVLANSDEKRHLEHAQAANQESLPELHEAQLARQSEHDRDTRELGDAKGLVAKGDLDRKSEADKHRRVIDLLKIGRRLNPTTGEEEVIPYEDMTPDQQVTHDLRIAQRELADSNRDLADARAKNLPEQMKLAERRIANAQHNQAVALRRLDLSEKQFEMRSRGTLNGEVLPGAMLTEGGDSVGTAFQGNVRPTGAQRSRSDLAVSATEQIDDMESIIKKRPDIFGPLAGRKTDFTTWIGSQDPDASRFRSARTIAAEHAAGAFGSRAHETVKDLENAFGQFKDNPEAAIAGLEAFKKASKSFKDAGTVRTAGASNGGNKPDSGGTAEVWVRENGKLVHKQVKK